jgi:uncharacterized protein Smg (DUF494 family)
MLIKIVLIIFILLPLQAAVEQDLALLHGRLTALNQQIGSAAPTIAAESREKQFLTTLRSDIEKLYESYKTKLPDANKNMVRTSLHGALYDTYQLFDSYIKDHPFIAGELQVIKRELEERGFDDRSVNNKYLKYLLEKIKKADVSSPEAVEKRIQYLNKLINNVYLNSKKNIFASELELARSILKKLEPYGENKVPATAEVKEIKEDIDGFLASTRESYDHYRKNLPFLGENDIQKLHNVMFTRYQAIDDLIKKDPSSAEPFRKLQEQLKGLGFDTEVVNNKALKKILDTIERDIEKDKGSLAVVQARIRYLRAILEHEYFNKNLAFVDEYVRARKLLDNLLTVLPKLVGLRDPEERPTRNVLNAEAKKLSAKKIKEIEGALVRLLGKKELARQDDDQIDQYSKRLHDAYFEAMAQGDMEQLRMIHAVFYKMYSLLNTATDTYRKSIVNRLKESGFDSADVSSESMRKVLKAEIEALGKRIKIFRETEQSERESQKLRELQENKKLLEKLISSTYFKREFHVFMTDVMNLIKLIQQALAS